MKDARGLDRREFIKRAGTMSLAAFVGVHLFEPRAMLARSNGTVPIVASVFLAKNGTPCVFH